MGKAIAQRILDRLVIELVENLEHQVALKEAEVDLRMFVEIQKKVVAKENA